MPGSSLPTSVAVSRICSRDPAERRNERGRTLEAPAPGVVVNLTKPAPGRTGGQTARNPLGSTPSRNLDRLPRRRPRRSMRPTAWNPTTLATSSPARAFCATSTRSSIEMAPTRWPIDASRVRIPVPFRSWPRWLVESRPELHTELVMVTRGCLHGIPLGTRRSSEVGGFRTELHVTLGHRSARRQTGHTVSSVCYP